jgi:aspartate carbamoyltransferase catalytic subunit
MMNRGIEIDTAVADGTQSVILPQVTNGLMTTRMAIMALIMGGTPTADTRRAP